MVSVLRVVQSDVDVTDLLAASLRSDAARFTAIADAAGADADALRAVAALLPVPLLHACRRRHAGRLPVSWVEGHCPLCGAWPACAEVRGIERSRHFRCGRCGSEWHARLLHCPFCATPDHADLVSLVPEDVAAASHAGAIDACRRCHGYVKTFARLQGCAPEDVLIEDLASVHLDAAALARGYARPPGTGRPLDATVTAAGRTRRLFGWRS
jgi:FdhE protein